MLVLPGGEALSDFRKQKLLKNIQKIEPGIKTFDAQFVHFIDASNLSTEEQWQLAELLGSSIELEHLKHLLLVVPRPGTISPWSSKASDIAKNSGLDKVKRIERGVIYYFDSKPKSPELIGELLHDRMTEKVLDSLAKASNLFTQAKPRKMSTFDIKTGGRKLLEEANESMGLALSDQEIDYLHGAYQKLGRNPTDTELMMFGLVNSEHCRHKIFNADFIIDGQSQPKSLFGMIKNTYEHHSEGVMSAYSDNAAVLKGPKIKRLMSSADDKQYRFEEENANLVIKVETHNHPTAISPNPGAATGVGGEIRDIAATGRGGKSKGGLVGYSVSNLQIPGAKRPWEVNNGKPERISSALEIMLEAPIGGAGYANEFGRPNIGGYFRTFEQELDGKVYGYHKPIMLAGSVGNTNDESVQKNQLKPGDKVVVIGGPAMLIGLGGGAASSQSSGEAKVELDFASVQRANAEMQRRAQEVIDRCWNMADKSPIITIGDVGAGGLSVAIPEMLSDSSVGGQIQLRDIPSADPGLSPMEIWCNEAQERYVLGISVKDLETFQQICQRERCPIAVVGEVKEGSQLVIEDEEFSDRPVDIPLDLLFGNPPKMLKDVKTEESSLKDFDSSGIEIDEAVERVLQLPAVASKKFLITIGDRTVSGLVARDPMVGPWQVPVSDVAVTSSSYEGKTGEAMSIGERAPLALINSAAAARVAVGEAITNILAADVAKISNIKLSANWMAASGERAQDQKLFAAVKAVGEQFCPELGLTIPVGKDSLSMSTKWQDNGDEKSVTSPVSLVVSAFSPVNDVSKTLTPQLQQADSSLILIDLGSGKNRLGASALAQVYSQLGNESPDIESELLKKFFDAITTLKKQNRILSYHDRSDGGLLTSVAEMMFAGRIGVELELSGLAGTALEKIFNEELGALIEVDMKDATETVKFLKEELGGHVHLIGHTTSNQMLVIKEDGNLVYENTRAELEKIWTETSYLIQKMRDNPKLAEEEFSAISDDDDSGLHAKADYQPVKKTFDSRPKVAIFRDEGVNGQVEMAAAFTLAGFDAVDVHTNDLVSGEVSLKDFKGLVACGGFSYGDVLGAGEGWAKSILFHPELRSQLSQFFERPDTFSLGVCNGCQAMSAMKDLIPGAEHWPRFLKNSSEQFEGRLVMAKVNESPSIFFKDMAGWSLPVPVAHGEGRAVFDEASQARQVIDNNLVPMQFIDNHGDTASKYPANPNSSPLGITALTSLDGRATILMPHPERVFLTKQLSWRPKDWGEKSPWFKLFENARYWVR